jgi:hypothetical protein
VQASNLGCTGSDVPHGLHSGGFADDRKRCADELGQSVALPEGSKKGPFHKLKGEVLHMPESEERLGQLRTSQAST